MEQTKILTEEGLVALKDNVIRKVNERVSINQGIEHFGNVLVINEEGNVLPGNASSTTDSVYHDAEATLELVEKTVLKDTVMVDSTLSLEGEAAEAKTVGEKIKEVIGMIVDPVQADWAETNTSSLSYIENKPAIPSIEGLATTTELQSTRDELVESINGKAEAVHNHNDVYYTESEIDAIVAGLNDSVNSKADTNHTHEEDYSSINHIHSYKDLNDKPFYMVTDPESGVLLEATYFPLNNNNEFEGENTYGVTFIVGETYRVTLNDIVYDNLLCLEINGMQSVGSSNLQLTDYPFIIASNSEIFDIKCSTDITDGCTVSIEQLTGNNIGEIYVESVYIPHMQADWNEESETAIGYVKNKPFSSKTENVVLLKTASMKFVTNTSYYFNECYVSIAIAPTAFVEDQEYNITWDDNTYVLKPYRDNDLGLAIGAEYLGLDNKTCDFTNYPFLFTIQESNGSFAIMILTNSTAETHTVGINGNITTITQMDEKFIPDTIARTQYVDENFALKSDLQNIELSNATTTDRTIVGAINELNAKHTEGTEALILVSPNGTKFNITVGDDGVLKSDEITE